MVVLPRHRRRSGNPYGNPHRPPGDHDAHDRHAAPLPAPRPRLFSPHTLLILVVGLGLGYVLTINLVTDYAARRDLGLNALVQTLERQQAAAAARNAGLSSPLNALHVSRHEAAALLRGEGPRGLSSADDAGAGAEGGAVGGVHAREEPATPPSPIIARGKRKKHHTFVEQEEAADLTAAQERFVETQKLLSFDTK